MSSRTIDRPNLNEIVSEHIKQQIFEGNLEPGSKIVEDDIAQSLGTSRTPVKLALTELAKDGLVELVPRRGAFVREFTHTDVIELYEIRHAFEGLAGKLAARHIQENDLEELRQINRDFHSAISDLPDDPKKRLARFKRTKQIDMEFHRVILKATNNRHLANLMGLDVIEFLSFLYGEPREPEAIWGRTYSEHDEIIEALRRRDESTAEQLLKHHILQAIDTIEENHDDG